ncbi:MAG: CusA/CzcA family heavy metal efflux RND transporter [Bacteroidales bacterium]|nr:CusA/CzcA family heavy metal efflux RND transporter [Bacteroidales bacterium]
MLNRIIKFSLQSRLTVLVLTIVAMAAGMAALLRMDVDIFPDLNAPTVVVMTEAQGMAPEEVERSITFPIETAVNGASGVRRVRSASSSGFSVVWVEFDWDTDIYHARQTVAERITSLAEDFPPGAGVPTMGPQSSILGEMMIIGLTADSTSVMELRDIADRTIAPRLLAMAGVAQVSVLGGEPKEYQIQLSSAAMRQRGVTLQEVIAATESLNDNVGGGSLYQYGNEYIVKGDMSAKSADDIEHSVVRSDDQGIVTLGDIAQVTVAPAAQRLGTASIQGQEGVLITVTKQPGAGTIPLTQEIEERLETLRASLPTDITISTDIFRQSDFIDRSIGNLQSSLFEGAIFVVMVLFFFLMNLRATIVSLVALPLSIILTLLVLHAFGFTINTMSLGGIAIAIGSLVDDAIVDVENVYKRLRENHAKPKVERKGMLDVVYHASAEVRMPIFNSSLIIIASFLPLFFLSGMEGRMLIPLGVAFIVALIASTIVALTVTPVLCSMLLGTKKAMEKMAKQPWVSVKLREGYSRLLARWLGLKGTGAYALPRGGKAMLWATGALFAVAVGLFFTLGRSFLPPFNEGSFTINVSTLPGIALDESDQVGRIAEELIMSVPEIQTVARKTGRSELDEHSLGVNVSEIEAPYKLSGRSRGEVAKELRQKLSQLPGVNIEIGQPISHRIDAMLSGTEAQVAIKLFGDDLPLLFLTGNEIKEAIEGIPGVVDANIEQQMERPQLDIRPKREMMAAYGITSAQLRDVIETAMGGKAVSKVYEEAQPYDLVVIFDEQSRATIDGLKEISIDSRFGMVPLSTVADFISSTGPNAINRENVKRRIVISANVEGRDLRGAVNDMRRAIEEQVVLPQNYYVEYGGQFESEASASRTLLWTSLGALLIIFMLLYHEFGDWRESLIVLVNMPLAMIGGVLVLFFTGADLNIPAIIGFISLLGITTRNGMLLISRYNALEAAGVGLRQRVMQGSTDRLLPIVMTALTTALALIPIVIKGNLPGNEIQSPLAIVILGGIISSTILNLIVVPAIYLLVKNRTQPR